MTFNVQPRFVMVFREGIRGQNQLQQIPKFHFCVSPILLGKGRRDEAWEPC